MPNPNTVTLVANTVSTIAIDGGQSTINVHNVSGTATLWVSPPGGVDPTVGGAGFYPVLPGAILSLPANYVDGNAASVKVIASAANQVTVFGAEDPDDIYLAGGNGAVDTEAPAAVVGNDAITNPTSPVVFAAGVRYNGTSWDRWRNVNSPLSVDSSSARTASGTGTTFTNYNGRAVTFYISVTAVSGTSPTLTLRVQESYDGTNWLDMDTTNLQTASITATGTARLRVGVGLANVANSSANLPAPRLIRLAWTIGGTTPSFTFQTWAVAHV